MEIVENILAQLKEITLEKFNSTVSKAKTIESTPELIEICQMVKRLFPILAKESDADISKWIANFKTSQTSAVDVTRKILDSYGSVISKVGKILTHRELLALLSDSERIKNAYDKSTNVGTATQILHHCCDTLYRTYQDLDYDANDFESMAFTIPDEILGQFEEKGREMDRELAMQRMKTLESDFGDRHLFIEQLRKEFGIQKIPQEIKLPVMTIIESDPVQCETSDAMDDSNELQKLSDRYNNPPDDPEYYWDPVTCNWIK
jgi:hypothetical protein